MTSLKFSHSGPAVSDIGQAADFFRDILGYRVISGPFDDPVQKVAVCFLGLENWSLPGAALRRATES